MFVRGRKGVLSVGYDNFFYFFCVATNKLYISPKVFDFGLCRVVKKRRIESQKYAMTGNTGSLRYMAPEVVLNHPYSEKVRRLEGVVWCVYS